MFPWHQHTASTASMHVVDTARGRHCTASRGEKTKRIGSQVGELKMPVVGYFSRFERFFGEGSRIHLQLSLK